MADYFRPRRGSEAEEAAGHEARGRCHHGGVHHGGDDEASVVGGIGVWPPCEPSEIGRRCDRSLTRATSLGQEPYKPNGPDLALRAQFFFSLEAVP